MSTQLPCVITINSVGDIGYGVDKIIITAHDSQSRVWPDGNIADFSNALFWMNVILIVSIIAIIAIVSNYLATYFKTKKLSENNSMNTSEKKSAV